MNSHNFGSLFTPDYSHLTGLLKHLNAEELKSILNNEDKTNDIINDLKQVKDIEAEREMLIAGNKSISEYNLSQKSVLEESRENLDTTYRRALELKETLLSAKTAIENKSVAQSKDTLLALLQAATSEIEEEAETTVDAFLRKDLSVEDFLEKYLELRKLAHLRRIKAEKLVSIIQGNGNSLPTPEKPQRMRKPPAPPVPKPFYPPYPSPSMAGYANNAENQNFPTYPSRPAPQIPAMPNPFQPQPNRMTYPSPFTYSSPYVGPQPQKYPFIRKG